MYVCIYVYIHIFLSLSLYIYIYIYTQIDTQLRAAPASALFSNPGRIQAAASLRTKILDFGGFASSRILISRGWNLRPIGISPYFSSQQIFAGRILVGRLASEPGRAGCDQTIIRH